MSTATVVGRLSAAAVVDGLLWPVDAPAAGLRGRLPLVVVEALAGGGKTSFVEFYAMTFGGGYPGGALWLDAHGHDPAWAAAPSFQRDADRLDQLAQAASALGVDLSNVDPAVWPATVAAILEAEQRDVLWIVDDLVSGSDHADLDLWAPRCSRAHVLASTRDAGSSLAASRFILQPLDDAAALRILTHRLPPTTERELGAAAQLVELVAKHPLTLDVIGAAVAAPGGPRYSEFLSEMTGAVEAAGPTVGQLAVNLPEGAEQAIVAALSSSVRDLTADGFDFLRLAFQLSAAPLPRSFVVDVFGARLGGDEGHAARRMRRAFREIDVLKMADRVDDGDAYQLHPIVTMVARLVDDQPDESERMLEAALVSLTTSLAQVIDVSVTTGAPPRQPWSCARCRCEHARTSGDPGLGGPL